MNWVQNQGIFTRWLKKTHSPITCKVEHSGCCLGLTTRSKWWGTNQPFKQGLSASWKEGSGTGNIYPISHNFSPIFPVLYVHSRGLQWSQQAREDALTRGRHIWGTTRQAMHSYQTHHLIAGHVMVPPVIKAVISICVILIKRWG